MLKKVNYLELESLRSAMNRAKVCDLDLLNRDFAEMLDRLISLARQHHKLAEVECNGEMTDAQVKHQAFIERIMFAIAQVFNLKVEFGGDPRGFTVKLHAPNGDMYNTWGGAESGYGIGEN